MPLPTRSQLTNAELVRPGRPAKADILKLVVDGQAVMVKDYARKPAWARLTGRIQVSREIKAYRWLGPIDGIPKLYGRVDAHALAVEWIDGELLAHAEDRVRNGVSHVGNLRRVMDRIHSTGLAHLDLRSNKNVMLRPDGEIVVVDLASAVCLRPGGLLHRWLFPALRANDLTGYFKWKQTLSAGELTAEERAIATRHERLRSLWFINRKRR